MHFQVLYELVGVWPGFCDDHRCQQQAAPELLFSSLFYRERRWGRVLALLRPAFPSPGCLPMHYWFVRPIDENLIRPRTLTKGAGNQSYSFCDLWRRADQRGFKIVVVNPVNRDSQTTILHAIRQFGLFQSTA